VYGQFAEGFGTTYLRAAKSLLDSLLAETMDTTIQD
jgi:hypothetical protein